jgi:NAD(P)-dependent dehydrogenase (short-subunit alcohol dehydrogenase family)
VTPSKKWTEADLPGLAGRRALVTGANTGIGLETARGLATHGAEVVLACRGEEVLARLEEQSVAAAMDDIRRRCPQAKLAFLELDLASLASIRAAAAEFHRRFKRLDILINNAGVMWLPRSTTRDGFELQIGVNHFGPFALTGLLLPALLNTLESRVVTVSSLAHLTAELDLADLDYERRPYKTTKVYSQTKLANLLFARELGRRLEAAGATTLSVAAHPGVVSSHLFLSALPNSKRLRWLLARSVALIGQSCVEGARPSLYAACESGLTNGDYVGPRGFRELWGYPRRTSSTAAANDGASAKQLWEESERRTGVKYTLGPNVNRRSAAADGSAGSPMQ